MGKASEHAIYPPSASHRWINCPGSIVLAPPEGPETDGRGSVYAWEGTICHELSATCLKTNKRAEEFLHQEIEDVEITPELADAIQMYVDEVKSTASDLGTKGGLIETKVEIIDDCWGTVDASLWNSQILAIIDAKFGKGVIVEVEGNTQLMIYAIGMLKALKAEGTPIPETVMMKIVQPRTVNPVREWSIPTKELQEWARDILAPATIKLREQSVDCKAGEWCRWCPVENCSVQTRSNLEKAAEAFAPFTTVEMPEIDTSGSLVPLEDMAKLALSFKQIGDWMSDVTAQLTTRALAGEDVPYWKMVAGRSVRKWGTEEAQLVEFLRGHDIVAYKEVLKTAPAVEKEIGKKKAKEIALDNHIIKPEGTPTLVPETDKRPALAINVEKQFSEFAEATDMDGEQPTPLLVIREDDVPEMNLMQRLMGASGSSVPDEVKLKERIELKEAQKVIDPPLEYSTVPDSPIDQKADAEEAEYREEIATSGDLDEMTHVGKKPKPPSAPKRRKVLDTLMEAPGQTLEEVAEDLDMTVNNVRMHLRYLHERDNYGYHIYKDGRVTIEK